MGLKGYFIQYKFIIPENVRHSSYTYQKLFRALYGYTQAVFKSNGRVYHYHRPGVLSDIPYIRPGKNCVIIPPWAFQKLIDFFKTGRNPTHQWRGKGEWKAVYYMNEKDVEERKAMDALNALLSRVQVKGPHRGVLTLPEAIQNVVADGGKADDDFNSLLLSKAREIVDSAWFKAVYPLSGNLKNFYSLYRTLKNG
jgi:hypothetical protein